MRASRVNVICKELLRLNDPRYVNFATVLVSCRARQFTGHGGRHLWNLHVHGKDRKGTGPFLLIAISEPPMDDAKYRFDFNIDAIFLVPRAAAAQKKTLVYRVSYDDECRKSWLDDYRVVEGPVAAKDALGGLDLDRLLRLVPRGATKSDSHQPA